MIWIDWTTIVFSGISAVIGGSITYFASYKTHRWLLGNQENREKEIVRGFYQALYDEVESLWDIYMSRIGNKVESLSEGQPLDVKWPVVSDYFTVYNMNNPLLGRIRDNDLRRLIVNTYTRARGLLDSYRMHYDIVDKLEIYHRLLTETGRPEYEKLRSQQILVLVDYSKKLKEGHLEVKDLVNRLLIALRKLGVTVAKMT